jgi:hypothetical protein
MCLSDLELDYINPFDSASSINKFVLVEFIIQGALCAVFLLTGHWLMALINAPLVYYNANLYVVLFYAYYLFQSSSWFLLDYYSLLDIGNTAIWMD